MEKQLIFSGDVQGIFRDGSDPIFAKFLKKIAKGPLSKRLPIIFSGDSLLLRANERNEIQLVILRGNGYIQIKKDRIWAEELIYEVPGEVMTLSGGGKFSGKKMEVQGPELIYLGKSRRILFHSGAWGFFNNPQKAGEKIYFLGDWGEVVLDKKGKINLLLAQGEPVYFWGQDFRGHGQRVKWAEKQLWMEGQVFFQKEKKRSFREKIMTQAIQSFMGNQFFFPGKKEMTLRANKLHYQIQTKEFRLSQQVRVTFWPPSQKKSALRSLKKIKKSLRPGAPWVLWCETLRGKILGKNTKVNLWASSGKILQLTCPQNGVVLMGKTLNWEGKKQKSTLLGDGKTLPSVTVKTIQGIQKLWAKKIIFDSLQNRITLENKVGGILKSPQLSLGKKTAGGQSTWKISLQKLVFQFSKKSKEPLSLRGSGPCSLQKENLFLQGNRFLWDFGKKKITLFGRPFAHLREGDFTMEDQVIEYDLKTEKIRSFGGGEWKNQPRPQPQK